LLKLNSLGTYIRIFNKYWNTPTNNWYAFGTWHSVSSTWWLWTYDGSTSDLITWSWYFETGKRDYYVVTRNSWVISFYKNWRKTSNSWALTSRNMSNNYDFLMWAIASEWWMNWVMADLEAYNTAIPDSLVKNKYAFYYWFM